MAMLQKHFRYTACGYKPKLFVIVKESNCLNDGITLKVMYIFILINRVFLKVAFVFCNFMYVITSYIG